MAPRVSVVTGGSSGIGAAIALGLARRGDDVGLISRRPDALEAVAAEIRKIGGNARVAPTDVSNGPAVRTAIGQIADEFGPIDLLIASAGVAERNPADDFSGDRLARIFAVNVLGAAYAFQAVLPSMIERGQGRIVGISSLAGFRAAMPGHSAYAASKAALSTLLEGLRLELRPRGVGVTAVHPGFVDTPMTAGGGFRPGMIGADRAAGIILLGIERGRDRIDFPRRAALLMQILRACPDPIHRRIVDGIWG
ncbi:MAG: SDR family NAD(P)-dependent oxidoreductase [Isosphaeraceae bacterium]